ncbi:MAG: hypothetical protein CMN28_14970 [Salinisphaeraceae bacterium]|nr:hypothetical protein [Salinisphaeraceae bacterium]
MKYLIGLVLILAGWRLYKWRLEQRIRAEQQTSQAPRQPQGPRFITILSLAILAVYGGYTLWVVLAG